jgi:MSHA pilin protein MshD
MLTHVPSIPHGRQSGISLVELILFIIIIGVALTGTLLGINLVTERSSGTLVQKQAQTAAESLLEEIEAHTYSGGSSCNGTLGANAARSGVPGVCNYNGYTSAGIRDFYSNAVVAGLGAYNVSPAVDIVQIASGVELGTTVPATSAVRITVSVTDPTSAITVATGYRTAH